MERVESTLPLELTILCSIMIVAPRGPQFILVVHPGSEPKENVEDKHNEKLGAVVTVRPAQASWASDWDIEFKE